MRDSIQEFGPECWEELDSVTRSGVRPIDDNCYCAAVLNKDQDTSKHNEMIGGTRAGLQARCVKGVRDLPSDSPRGVVR
jgi:hypothetical protein